MGRGENPYDLLGVAASASAAEIQKAYRKLAKKHHPDLNRGDKSAEDKFKEISSAYNLLGDAEKRKRFDASEIDASGTERPSSDIIVILPMWTRDCRFPPRFDPGFPLRTDPG